VKPFGIGELFSSNPDHAEINWHRTNIICFDILEFVVLDFLNLLLEMIQNSINGRINNKFCIRDRGKMTAQANVPDFGR
jgi:hypothetical protein